jgi:two-component system KDP operon response regulator KdpE
VYLQTPRPAFSSAVIFTRVFMTQIRHKLEPEPSEPRYFITEPGLGFVT